MSILDIPFLSGKKSAIAGYGLMVGGIGSLLVVVGDCMTAQLTLQQCIVALQSAVESIMVAFGGLGIIGVAHKIEKATKA